MHERQAFIFEGEEIVITDEETVSCDGGGGALGHPVEYMRLPRNGEITCKYCDRRFIHPGHPLAETVRKNGKPFSEGILLAG